MGTCGPYKIQQRMIPEEINSSIASRLLLRQRVDWPLAQKNYLALEHIKTKSFNMGGFTIKIQFTPSRIISSGAKIDFKNLSERKCFLCPSNLPEEQEKLAFGTDYSVLCNPYPIFTEHFTIATHKHINQEILSRFGDFLELTRQLDAYTLFYNGPKSGASAPDHAHFQAVSRNIMPLDYEWKSLLDKQGKCLINQKDGQLYTITNYLRNGFVIKAQTGNGASSLFQTVYHSLEKKDEETEPGMNLFGKYIDNSWVIILIPRKQHRPRQFYLEGEQQILSSPGGADIGGLFITAREEDFNKMTPEIICNIYQQVCYSNEEINEVAQSITKKNINTSIKR